jgi:DNA mismatch repair ATPase MutS
MNVARLAGLPESLVQRAAQMSNRFESSLRAAHQHANGMDVSSSSSSSSAAASAESDSAIVMRKLMKALKVNSPSELRALLHSA